MLACSIFSVLFFFPVLFEFSWKRNEFVKVRGRSVCLFCPLFFLFCLFFFVVVVLDSYGSRANISDSTEEQSTFLSLLCALVFWTLMPLWSADWELSITRRRTGSLLKKVHVGQKEMAGAWQAGWMEGGQAISRRLVGALLLVKLEPPCYCPSCVKDIPRALFWL